jgi:hypothetical protein
MDQPTAQQALKELEPLIGEWTVEASAGRRPRTARTTGPTLT